MESTKGRQLHKQSLESQEKGNFGEALELSDRAMVTYQEDGDKVGFSEIQAMRFLILKHLYERTDDNSYMVLAKYSAMAGVELAEASGDKTALTIPYFNLAKTFEALGEYKEAVDGYKKAIINMEESPAERHNRPSVIADFKGHLAICEYKTGDKTAIERALEAIEELRACEEEKYTKDVWLSGGYMRLAEALKNDNREEARKYLDKAKEIIDANEELKLRKEQWEKLAESFA